MTQTDNSAIVATPLNGHIGAEISNIDLGRPLAQADFDGLQAALARYEVLVFRDQDISLEAQIAFAKRFSLLSTDLADYLVKQGVPFRRAHHLVGEVVQLAENRGVPLTALTLTDLKTVSELFGEGATAVFNIPSSLSSRSATGGTAPEALQAQLNAAKQVVSG